MMKLLFIFGTRPEAIKLAPVILKAQKDESFDVRICVTGQHNEMLHQVLDFFRIEPDYDLNIMQPDQSLYDVTANTIKFLENVIASENPSLVLVQGDTTTAFIGALASFYQKVPVAHIEAGLRSHNKYSPFPEEINRVLVGHLADYHFAPTLRTKENLIREGINEDRIYIVGNTVIDALFLTLEIIKNQEDRFLEYFDWLNIEKPIILVTCHRRESFGEPFKNICLALRDIAEENNVEIVYPVHLNPNVREPVFEILNGLKNIHLIEPLSYPYLVWLMEKSSLILTDSGGIQEEAPSLGKPVLVMREVTERVEGIEAGTCKLVGTEKEKIVDETIRLLTDLDEYERMAKSVNPYGDGKSSKKILKILSDMI
ncbi:MAG: UDP-N-acetylglucosamine 2-epimerase (non-hydrolyzing) [Thermodesulfovibrionales bacterium]|nr:UDP-N-acetylglucosamine 2-epimerase (non-hydrolyzing) [Thermodesulfovibrionales bacterium]